MTDGREGGVLRPESEVLRVNTKEFRAAPRYTSAVLERPG
jgi:hypothetical protein